MKQKSKPVTTRDWSDLPQRLLTILIGVPLLVMAIVVGYPLYHLGVVILSVLSAFELARVVRPPGWIGGVLAQGLGLSTLAALALNAPLLLVGALMVALSVGAWLSRQQDAPLRHFLRRYALLMGAVLYVNLALGLLIPLREAPQGLLWLVMLCAAVWGTDSFALVGGRLWGRTPLAPRLSPGKTREGALTGFLAGTLTAGACALIGGYGIAFALVAGASMAFMTILGDLIESAFKRFCGVKDASGLLPGHGGFLDRLDGLALAAPTLYVLTRFWL